MLERHNWHDAMTARLAQHAWTRSADGQRWMSNKLAHDSYEYREHTDLVELMTRLYLSEAVRLEGATPFFVSADMTTLVEHASKQFSPEAIYPTDVLKLQGFMWYEKPLPLTDRFGREVQLRAVSWNPVMGGDVKPDRLLTRDDEVREYLGERHEQGKVDGLAISLYEEMSPEVVKSWPEDMARPTVAPLHITPWWWGMSYEGNDVTIDDRPTGAEWWWRVVQATWRLMQQHIAIRHYERPTRPQRREAKRMNVSADDVIIVRLRRETTRHNGEPLTEMHYTHRFMVEGHWRNQPYGPRGGPYTYRQIYIADYEKGPEGAPLIIKPNRVFNWNR